MGLSIDEYKQRMKNRPSPYIGFEGIGCRISLKSRTGRLTIKESIASQLFKVVGLLLFGPGLTALAVIEKEQILKRPWPILAVTAFFSLVGWFFGFRFLLQLLGNRRVEVCFQDGSISLISQGNSPDIRIERSSISRTEIASTWFSSSESGWIENFTLRLVCQNGKVVDLCTSNSKLNIETVKSALDRAIS